MKRERELYDLGHYSHTCGKLGRLQTLTCVPVVAGDSFEMDCVTIIRLAALRKEIVAESVVDICGFYVPHRHVYDPQDWIAYVQGGWDTTVTLPSFTLPNFTTDQYNDWLGIGFAGVGMPLWALQGYNMIWDRYYRVPSMDRLTSYNDFPTGTTTEAEDIRKYGRRCARLPTTWNDAVKVSGGTGAQAFRDLTSADYSVPSATVLDLQDLAEVQGRYKSEINRTWFTERYKDVLERQWNTTVNIDADERPEMLFREQVNMSGSDVDGTDDATLGQYVGKTIVRINIEMPRKHFAEHGAFWIMALVRWPSVHVWEQNYMTGFLSPDPKQLLADPDIWPKLAPQQAGNQWFGANVAYPIDPNFQRPYGQWYRAMNNRVHRNFADIPGYPFLKRSFANWEEVMYYQPGDYDDVFQTSQLGHWQAHTNCKIDALRHIPPVNASVYAGAN